MEARKDSLWRLIAGPTIWAAYFIVVYFGAAVFCAKAGGSGDFFLLRLAILGLGLAALVGIAYAGAGAWTRWRSGGEAGPPHDADTIGSRHQFLALATLLLCGLSFVATVYVALPALFFTSCR